MRGSATFWSAVGVVERLFTPVVPEVPIAVPDDGSADRVDEYWSEHTVKDSGFRSAAQSRAEWDLRFREYPLFREFQEIWGVHDDEVVLDYGCGPGNDVTGFLTHTDAALVIGMDVSMKSMRMTQHRLKLHGIGPERVRLICIRDQDDSIPLPDASIDFVNCQGVLHHTSDPDRILAELARVLKPGGRANIMVYNRDSVWMHLYVAYELMLLRGESQGCSLAEAFQASTDGPDCPISRAYSGEEFLAMCRRAGFEGEFVGGYLSLWEMGKLAQREAAISDPRMPAESVEFLRELTLDGRGYPLHGGRCAGIGGSYRLRKSGSKRSIATSTCPSESRNG